MSKNSQLLEFMNNELPTANLQLSLKRYKVEILELKDSGYAIHQIQKYLANFHNLKISRQYLSLFIKNEKRELKQ